MSQRTVLVTGGAGYIGSHVCKQLALSGFTPVTYDNLCRGHTHAVRWGPLEVGDILDTDRLVSVMRKHKIEGVLHFAAFAYVGESVVNPDIYFHNNSVGSLSLLRAMRQVSCDVLVFSSTCATYGTPSSLPITEAMAQNPINPYGHSKVIVERMIDAFGVAYGIRATPLRYFNAAGCDPEGQIGEQHTPETHAIPSAILAALGRRGPFEIFGTDYDTEDGSAVRDYIHVCDLADAHVRALRYLLEGGKSDAFNLATGRGTSVLEMLKEVGEVLGTNVPSVVSPRRPGDPAALVASAEKAQRILGWRSNLDLNDIVRTAANWFRNH